MEKQINPITDISRALPTIGNFVEHVGISNDPNRAYQYQSIEEKIDYYQNLQAHNLISINIIQTKSKRNILEIDIPIRKTHQTHQSTLIDPKITSNQSQSLPQMTCLSMKRKKSKTNKS